MKPQPKTKNNKGVDILVSQSQCRLFRRKDGKYLIYMPLALVEDSMFPFRIELGKEGKASIGLKVSFKLGKKELVITELKEEI